MAEENENLEGTGTEGTGEGRQVGSESSGAEEEARLSGWVPKEEFHGDESEWVDAETFVRRGKEINPILRKNNERLMAELKKRDKELAEVRGTLKEFGEHYKKLTETAYKRAQDEIKAQIRQARQTGDWELLDSLEENLDALKEESQNIKVPGVKEREKEEPQGEINLEAEKILQGWVKDNQWYAKSPALQATADGLAIQLARQRPDLVGTREFLDKVAYAVKKIHPNAFKNPNREAGSPAGGSSSTNSGARPSGKKTYSDLPPDAKAACDRFCKDIPGYTKEKYVSEYFGE